MKLAEALMERKAAKTKTEELKKRIYQSSRIQEGDTAIENPLSLIEELKKETARFENLIIRINRTNNAAKLSDEMTLMEAIVKKDMLNYLHLIHANLADKATPAPDRYSQREIKTVPNVDIGEIRKKADEIAKEYRMLDMKIQECNWKTELI
ncbi:DIP1984 family protein [Desulfobacterales bacterium HSG2]|nr:DIP1984 family protein [Desulfobacterales bacterium HSG2]